MVTNSVHKMKPIGGDTNFNAFILPRGEVIYTPGDVFEAKYPSDISKFPVEQKYPFSFMARAMPNYFIRLSSAKDQAELNFFYPHSNWTLLEYSTVAETRVVSRISTLLS